ncbi:MAG: LysR family transcriptional regulator [Burkholderiaceae bacterium]|nr:LysR family transcriptional regulator [Burkholderiaceae bacterium]MDO9089982.1 LysR family transcriptional regulator [Burkholderiaceae bacterium]MDP1968615.1 LysR family transcriptional regulator [Burkholderiaceae bacterium]
MPNPNFRTLDLNLLRVFDEVMAERSLTRAAHNLSLTQPAVSNALRRLRETLGDDLVRRSGQGVAPTPRALVLWPSVREALRQLQESLAPSEFDAATATTTFVMATADATAAALIPGLVEITEREAPGVSIRAVPLTTRDPRRLLEQDMADLAMGYFPAVLADLTAREQSGEPVSFDHLRLYDGEYLCVMRRDHPLAREELTLDSFCAARHMLVSFSGRPFGFIDEALASLGRKRRIVLTVNQFFTAGRVVAGSDLLTVLPGHFVRVTGIAEELALRPLPFDVPVVHVDALWHRRSQTQSSNQWLRGALARSAEQAFARHFTDGASAPPATAP